MDIKSKIESLKKTRESLKDELRGLEFEKSKLEEDLSNSKEKILELFGTTDVSVLSQKYNELKAELDVTLSECEKFLSPHSGI